MVYATVSLRSATTKRAVQIVAPPLAGAQTGTLGVRVASAGKKVEVDGLLVSAV